MAYGPCQFAGGAPTHVALHAAEASGEALEDGPSDTAPEDLGPLTSFACASLASPGTPAPVPASATPAAATLRAPSSTSSSQAFDESIRIAAAQSFTMRTRPAPAR